jgi:hypothetical protein
MNDKSHITMDCTDIKAMLSAIIDGAGDPDERHRAERHLAECATCRRLVSDAEQVDAMLAAAVDSDGPSDRLPEGFEGKVLSRTVFAAEAAHRWHSWLGWLAAAASIMLAVVMWTMDRTPSPGTFHATYRAGPELQSWALLEPPTDTAPRTRFVVNEVARYAVDTGPRPGNSRATTRSADTPTAPLKSPSGLSPLAAETIESVSMVMAMLQHADDRSFADVEHVRRITEYEKLLPHMAEIRGELPPSDRPPILAAEAMLYRIVRGPVSLEDVRELRYTIARMNLPERIAAISGLQPPPSSL